MLYDAFSISENREVLIQYLLKLGYKINAWGALFEEGRKDRDCLHWQRALVTTNLLLTTVLLKRIKNSNPPPEKKFKKILTQTCSTFAVKKKFAKLKSISHSIYMKRSQISFQNYVEKNTFAYTV